MTVSAGVLAALSSASSGRPFAESAEFHPIRDSWETGDATGDLAERRLATIDRGEGELGVRTSPEPRSALRQIISVPAVITT